MRTEAYIRLVIMTLILFGCKKPEDRTCFKSHGKETSVAADLVEFKTLVIYDHIHVNLTQSSENNITIHAGEHMINNIEVIERNDSLIIQDNNSCSFLRSYKREIHVDLQTTSLDYIRQRGTGDITCTNTLTPVNFTYETYDATGNAQFDIETDSLTLFVESGPSDITAVGTAAHVYAYHTGTGFMHCKNLKTDSFHAHHAGSGDFHIRSELYQLIELRYTGNLYSYGTPLERIVSAHTGSGEIFFVE